MTPDEIPQLIKRISYADPRIMPTDQAELMGMAGLWAKVLADVPTDYALDAVGAHYATSPYTIKPSDIATKWRAEVRRRMEQHTDAEPPTVDPDDEAAYRNAILLQRAAIATGTRRPTRVPELTGGPAPKVAALIGDFGKPNYVPDEARKQLADALPGWGRTLSEHPERAIRCPVDTCRAAERRPCQSLRTGRKLRDSHPSRIDAWNAAKHQEAS